MSGPSRPLMLARGLPLPVTFRPEKRMLIRWRRIAQLHPRLTEAAFLLLTYAATSNQYRRVGPTTFWWPGFALSALTCACLLARRRHPGPVVIMTNLATVIVAGAGAGGVLGPLILLPVIIALYELTLRSPLRTTRAHCLFALVVLLPAALRSDQNGDPWANQIVTLLFFILLPVVYGSQVRARHAYLDAVHARAEHAERTREEEARHRVIAERVRIARELHDVVDHHMALAHAQAGTIAHLWNTRPQQVEDVLGDLTRTTTAALRELQTTVGLLRQPDDTDEPLQPAPGLALVPVLVSAFASAGLQVILSAEGQARPLCPGADLTAFRILQEALTNVAKHATVTTAHVHLAYDPDQLTLTVDNAGSAPPPSHAGGGFGLIGMRERAQSAGGCLTAGHRPDGGYTVTVVLPIQP
ncbi:histidine kinase [Streptomyces sp. NPDC005897]|uniref:sensor histidine kinase n=1 Tax=Streptomyces sp. NPDC005897 TaxID=3157081 RepID=UPI0033CBA922